MLVDRIHLYPEELKTLLLEVYDRILAQVPVPGDHYPAELFLRHCGELTRQSVEAVAVMVCSRMQISHHARDNIVSQLHDPGATEPRTYLASLSLLSTVVLVAAVTHYYERFADRSLAAIAVLEGQRVFKPVMSHLEAIEVQLGRRRRQ